jgi:Holliday junction resolvase RusA-like endonuclease
MTELRLPFPPSVNNLFTGRGRRYPSARYRQWKQDAGWQAASQRPKRLAGLVRIHIVLTAPDKRRRDASNYVKAIEDLLVSLRVLEDDHGAYVKGVTAEWADQPGEPGAVVRIIPAA